MIDYLLKICNFEAQVLAIEANFMTAIRIYWFLLVGLLLCVTESFAQHPTDFPTDHDEFKIEFRKRLDNYKNDQVQVFSKEFYSYWDDGNLTVADKTQFIKRVNTLLAKSFRLIPDIVNYTKCLKAIKDPDSRLRIPTEQFFMLTDSCLANLNVGEFMNVIINLQKMVQRGIVFETSQFSWAFTQKDPRLQLKHDVITKDTVDQFGSPFTIEYTAFAPSMSFSNTDILYASKTDSTGIYNTKGSYNLITRRFKGQGGEYNWSRLGLPPREIYCTFDVFNINLSLNAFSADSVVFHYNTFLHKTLKGHFEEKIIHYQNIKDAKYPYFRSDEGGLTINNFIPNVTYTGGFSLRGVTKVGSRTEDEPARLMIKDKYSGFDLLKLESDEFALNPEKMETDVASVVLYLPNGDSITHPSLKVVYTVESGDLLLYKDPRNPFSHQPMLSSYHNYGLYFDAIKFNAKKKRIEFSALIDKENKFAAVESYDYFRAERFRQFKNVVAFNPIGLLYRYETEMREKALLREKRLETKMAAEEERKKSEDEGWETYTDPAADPEETKRLEEEAKKAEEEKAQKEANRAADMRIIYVDRFLKYFKQEAQRPKFLEALNDLEGSGYVRFDKKTERITILPKLRKWAIAAKGDKDYDVIQIISNVQAGNHADMNYESKIIQMYGVEEISLSDSQFVRLLPQDEKVFIREDRNFNMGGVVHAGKINLYGKGYGKFNFEYDNYKIMCDTLDSLKFRPRRDPETKKNNSKAYLNLTKALEKLTIQDIIGAVYINKPNNKSSLKPHPEYPVFDCYSLSYVYWGDSAIQNGVYGRDPASKEYRLKFEIDPFVLDSLENFDIRSLEFQGEFYADGIMNSFRDTLKPVGDNTYGIVKKTDASGEPIYKGKGKLYEGQVEMNGDSFHGNGKIDYLATTTESDSFIFHFDSVMAVTRKFYLPKTNYKGTKYPEIKAGIVDYKWHTQRDELVLTTKDENIELFAGEAKFKGKIIITPLGVKGSGLMKVGEIEIEGNDMNINEMDFTAPNATFRVADKKDPGITHFIAKKSEVKYNMANHRSEFESKVSAVDSLNSEFPQLNYKTSLGKGIYDKNTNEINMTANSVYQNKNYFTSTDPKQEGLTFPATSAVYNTEKKEISIDGVEYIYVADAKIMPDSGKVKIRPDGFMDKFRNARVEANIKTKYHQFYEGKIEVLSKYKYLGEAKYNYIVVNGEQQVIRFNDIHVKPDTTTEALAVIPQTQNFFITERIYFRDTVLLTAGQKYMYFSGDVRIQSSNTFLSDSWFEFHGVVNPDSIYIPINNPRNRKTNAELTVGLHYGPERRLFYSNFLQERKAGKDTDILTAKGGLTFDRATKEFRIGTEKKLIQEMFRTPVVSYDDSARVITSQGFFNVPYHLEPNTASYKMAGIWRDDQTKGEVKLNVCMGMNFSVLPERVTLKLSDLFTALTLNSPDIDYTPRITHESIAELIGDADPTEEKTKAFVTSINKMRTIKDIKIAKDLPFTFLFSDLKWTWEDKFKTFYVSEPVGLVGIGGVPINKMLNAKIEYTIGKALPTGQTLADTLRMYVEIDEDNWVYCTFADNVLKIVTPFENKGSFNELVGIEVDKLSKRKQDPNKKTFELLLGTTADKEKFTETFVKKYILKE